VENPRFRIGANRHAGTTDATGRRDGRAAGSILTNELWAKAPRSGGEIETAERELRVRLPNDLTAFLQLGDEAEGFVGGAYLAMWPVAELAELNHLIRTNEFAPDLVFFATDGGLEGYGVSRDRGTFVNVPLIGMGVIGRDIVGSTFEDFLWSLARKYPTSGEGPAPDPDPTRFGLIAHEVTPIIFGGSPTDPTNKTLIPLKKYAELVGWWNEQVRLSSSSGA